MTLALVDSSIWVDYLRGRAETKIRLEGLRGRVTVVVTEPIVMELLAGCRPRDVGQLEHFFDGFPGLEVDPYLDFRSAAALRRHARRSGHTVRSAMDGIIAAIALRHADVILIHNDVDFERIAQIAPLRQERWAG